MSVSVPSGATAWRWPSVLATYQSRPLAVANASVTAAAVLLPSTTPSSRTKWTPLEKNAITQCRGCGEAVGDGCCETDPANVGVGVPPLAPHPESTATALTAASKCLGVLFTANGLRRAPPSSYVLPYNDGRLPCRAPETPCSRPGCRGHGYAREPGRRSADRSRQARPRAG